MSDSNAVALLLPALLSMDVYHRDVDGGLHSIVDNLGTSLDDVTPTTISAPSTIGFFAKAYQQGGTTYIVYRGTDDRVIQRIPPVTAPRAADQSAA